MSTAAATRPSRLRSPLTAVIALTVLAAVVRFAVAGIPSYWLDEAFSISIFRGSLDEALHLIPRTESTPPLYYLLGWGWTQVFGLGELGTRSLSVLAGVATVPVTYAIAARLVSRRSAVIATALVACNPFLIWFSQEARAYSLLVLLVAAALYFFVVSLQQPSRRSLALWALCSALALATHYVAAFPFALEALWLGRALWRTPRRTQLLVAAGGVIAVGAALLPLAIEQRNTSYAIALERKSSLGQRIVELPKQFLVSFDAPLETLVALFAFALALAGVALLIWRGDPERRRGALLIGGLGVAMVLLPLLVAFIGWDYLSARYEVAALVPLLIALAAGFGARRAGRLGPGLAAALCLLWLGVVAGVAADPLLQTRADWRGVAEAIGSPPPGGRAIVLTPSSGRKPLEVYLPSATFEGRRVVSVQEVVLADVASTSEPSRPPALPPPGKVLAPLRPGGFEEVERRTGDTYTLVRYRAPKPSDVALDWLVGGRLDPDESFVLLSQR